ncbi:MAG TPA: serine hydrolase domain-containing protein [Abditibacteriaceae bacterium]
MSLFKLRFLACLITLFSACGSCFISARAAELTPEQEARVEEMARAEMKLSSIPGLSIAIVTGNQLSYARGLGLADLENSVPVTPKTVFRLASTSKLFTAVATMQLAENGKLQLDDEVQKYVPSFPRKPWPVTVRQLLTHTSGIRHYEGRSREIYNTAHYRSTLIALDIFKNDALLFEPGTRYGYSSYAFNLLGCVVEGASGQSFPLYIQDNITKPSGLSQTQVDDIYAIIPFRAQGYAKEKSGALRNSGLVDTSWKIPGGGLSSTPSDVARFLIALNNSVLLKDETRDLMWTRQSTRDGKPLPYGLGWQVREAGGDKWVLHAGQQQRVSAWVQMSPQNGVAVVLMCNLEQQMYRLRSLSDQITQIILNTPVTMPAPELVEDE